MNGIRVPAEKLCVVEREWVESGAKGGGGGEGTVISKYYDYMM